MPGQGIGVTERVANVTIAKWAKKVSELTTQKYALLSVMQKKGMIRYGCNGGELRWPFRFKDHDLFGHVDGAPKQFARIKTTKNANLEWRGYEANDAITLREKLENGGPEAMVKIFATREKYIRMGLIRQLGKEWFQDGNAAQASADQRFHGIDTFCRAGAQTASDELATVLNGTYAGQSNAYDACKPGAVKGVDEEYGVWSPVVVNTVLNPGSGVRAWADYADEYIRCMLIEASYGPTMEDQIDLILLRKSSYKDLLNLADDKERLVFSRGEDVAVVKMGFTQFVELDGCAIGWDFGVHATDEDGRNVHGYGFNTDRLELKLLNPKSKGLWGSNVTFNDDYQATRLYFYLLGNLQFESPRFFGKLVDLV